MPVVIQGGWYDLFQRGEPLLWESLKNSPDRVLFMSPHYHITKGRDGTPEPQGRMVQPLAAQGAKNGAQKTPKVNLYSINGEGWEHFKNFPLPKTALPSPVPERRLLGIRAALAARRLAGERAAASEAGDTEPLLPASSPCSRMTAQWTAGVASNRVCDTNNNTYEATSLTYTTAADAAPTRRSPG